MVHRKNVKINKKGITLETAVSLILIAISLGIVIIILFTSGIMSTLQTFICTPLTTGASWVRGFLVQQIWNLYGIIMEIMAVIFLTGSLCYKFPFGTAACLIMLAIFTAVIITTFNNFVSNIPLLYCPNPTLLRGCGVGSSGISNTTFFQEVADRSVDCWAMYAEGKFDPLSALEPPNPRTCFVIDFKVDRPVTLAQANSYLDNKLYSIGAEKNVTYKERLGGNTPNTRSPNGYFDSSTPFTNGRLFIKYGDDHTYSKWGSDDCGIGSDKVESGDRIYWCIQTGTVNPVCS